MTRCSLAPFPGAFHRLKDFPSPPLPKDLCPPWFPLLYGNLFFLGGAVSFTHSLSTHWHPLPKLTLPDSNLSFQVLFSSRATWLSSCRGLKSLQGSQEEFSHLTFLWRQRLDISVISKRRTLSASLTFAWWDHHGLSLSSPHLSPAYNCSGSQWAPEGKVLCRQPMAKGLSRVAKHSDMALRPSSPAGGSSYLGSVTKTPANKNLIPASTCNSKMLKICAELRYAELRKSCVPQSVEAPLCRRAAMSWRGQAGEVIPSPVYLQPH